MTEPHLYLEDLIKAAPPKPPAGQGPAAPKVASAPAVPKEAAAAAPGAGKAGGGGGGPKVKYDYWGNRPGSPDPADGWEQTESGKWRRPRGAGGGPKPAGGDKPKGKKGKATGSTAQGVSSGQQDQSAQQTTSQQAEAQIAAQAPPKKLVSSSKEKKGKKVSSAAAKLEQKKQTSTERDTVPIPADEQDKIQANPAEIAKVELDRLRSERNAAKDQKPVTEQDKIQKEAKSSLEKERVLKDAAEKKPAKATEPKKPEGADQKLILQHHNDQVNSLKDNIQSHIRWNRDMPKEEKDKLRTVAEALDKHGTIDSMPDAQQKKLLSVAKQVAGKYGKEKHQTKKEAAKEAAPKKKSDKEQLSRIESATGKKAKTAAKPVPPEQSRLRGKDEPPPLPSKKKQEQMKKEVDRDKKKEASQKEREKRAEDNKKAREQAQWDKKVEAAKQEIQRNTEAPNTPEGVQEQQAFKKQSRELAGNIQAHLDSGSVDEETKQQLENTLQILNSHNELSGLPSKEQKKAQADARKLAGKHGKPPKEPKEAQAKEQKKRPIPYGRMMGAGYRAGQAAGEAASSPEAAAGAIDAPAYAAAGASSIGQHLLHNRNVDKQNAEAKKQNDKTPKKGEEVKQSAMGKSLNLYIDLNKAAAGGDTATQPVLSPEDEKRKHEASYAKNPVGVANEGLVQNQDDNDEEEIEKKFKSKDQQKYMHAAEERGEIPKKVVDEFDEKTKDFKDLPDHVKKKTMKKSLTSGLSDIVAETFTPSFDMLKSLNEEIHREIRKHTPSSLEAEFMVEVLGHDVSAVRKGLCFIKGKDRHVFNEWAAERLSKSISNLNKRLS